MEETLATLNSGAGPDGRTARAHAHSAHAHSAQQAARPETATEASTQGAAAQAGGARAPDAAAEVAARRGSSSTGEGKCNGHGNGESHRERNGRAITSAALDGLGSGKVGGAGGAHAASARAGG